MLHPYDTHFWLARLQDGSWISAEDHSSADLIFAQATRIRIEPISLASIQAILEAEVPPGYTAFLRTDIHQDIQINQIAKLGYVMSLEKGVWPEPGRVAIGGFAWREGQEAMIWEASQLPLIDGFRAELCCWNGNVEFESSPNFSFNVSQENGIDIYKFMKR